MNVTTEQLAEALTTALTNVGYVRVTHTVSTPEPVSQTERIERIQINGTPNVEDPEETDPRTGTMFHPKFRKACDLYLYPWARMHNVGDWFRIPKNRQSYATCDSGNAWMKLRHYGGEFSLFEDGHGFFVVRTK